MLVYGDARRTRQTADLLDAVAADGPHAFYDASALAQGLVDAEFEASGEDDLTPTHAACLDLLLALACGRATAGELAALRTQPLPEEISVTAPEGYAFYAVYPQAYRIAARSVAWASPPLVIGLRSIGAGLAAVVAAATGGTPLTLRPAGHPFAREVRPSAALRARIAAHAGPFAVVDEGPGLSGSSFGSVVRLLEDLGVSHDRIVLLPSHAGGPGPRASTVDRIRWGRARRAVATLDDLLAADPIAGWFADLIGPATKVEDLSAGAWRTPGTAAPADPHRERRKFRLTTPRGAWLARFAGLGRTGEEKLMRARALHDAGFGPEPVTLRRGFLLERWESATPLELRGAERSRFLAHLGLYLAFRARAFPAGPNEGASVRELAEMIRVNGGVSTALPAAAPRIQVDARLHAWEWIRRGDGAFCKLDGIDHACGHDLVGCQPIAYDIAGATVEFELSPAELVGLLGQVAAEAGCTVDPGSLRFFEFAYASFQLGLWSLAEPSAATTPLLSKYRRRLHAPLPAC
jgi:hypothetical protein